MGNPQSCVSCAGDGFIAGFIEIWVAVRVGGGWGRGYFDRSSELNWVGVVFVDCAVVVGVVGAVVAALVVFVVVVHVVVGGVVGGVVGVIVGVVCLCYFLTLFPSDSFFPPLAICLLSYVRRSVLAGVTTR